MAGENVGTIYYTVEADTSRLVNSTQVAEASLDGLERRFSKTDKAANEANFTMTKTAAAIKGMGGEASGASSSLGSLAKVLGGLLTLQGVNSLVQMAEGYNEMAERVRMASGSVAEYELVQQRLLATANGTYRSLSEAQEIYIRTADSLRTMGYSASESLDITDSLSYAFVRSATSADRAQIAMGAFSRSLSKGRVDSDAWEMLLISVPSLAQDMSTALGKTAEEIRKMGAEGKVTTDQLAEGLRKSLDVNKAAADGMAVTVRDAFTAMRNNLAAYLGEANQATGATNLMSTAILGLSKNIDVIVKTLTAAGAGAMALYVAKTGAAAIASAQSAVQSLRVAQAKAAEAAASTAAASAAGTHAAAATAESASMNAGAAAAANKARSLMTMVGAQRAATVAGTALIGAMGGLPGLIAIVASAAAGWYLFSDSAQKASGTLDEMARPLEETIARLKDMNEAQRADTLVRYTEAQAQAAENARDAFDKLFSSVSSVNVLKTDWSVRQWGAFREELQAAQRAGEDLTPILQRAANQSGVARSVTDSWLKLNGEFDRALATMKNSGGVIAAVSAEIERLAASSTNAAASQRDLNAAFNDTQTDDYLKRLRERREAIEDEGSAVKAAERYIASLTDVSAERIAQIREEAAAVDRGNAAKRAAVSATKQETEAQRQAKQAAEERKRADEANIETLDKMAQALYFAGLQGEALAVAQARASLNEFATPEQVANLEAMARALYQVQQVEQQRQKFGQGQKADQYIMGSVSPLSGGAFDEQYARYEAEAQVEQERYAAQMERLKEARELQIETSRSYDQLEQEAAQQHADRLAQIEQAKNKVLLSSASDAFGAMADIMKQSKGEQAGIYKAMFAASKAFAIADATINAYGAISKAWNSAPFPANMAAVAATTPQVMSVVSAISGASYGGGRQYGGPVAGGKGYRINENGAPEILNTASGRQYLLPNSRGEVVSNKDATGGGGVAPVNVTVQLIEDASRGGQVEQSYANEQYVLNICVASIRRGTDLAQAVEGTYGISRRGR